MNLVPVADHGEDQEDKCNQQQSGRLRRVHGMPVMPVVGIIVSIGGGHEVIVAPAQRRSSPRNEVFGFGCWRRS